MANYNKAIPFKATSISKGHGYLRLTPGSAGIADARRRSTGGTLKPDNLNTGEPPVGVNLDMVYDYDGTYLGWTEHPNGFKWCYGISYKSGKRYNVVTEKGAADPFYGKSGGYNTRMVVYDNSTSPHEVAMVIWERELKDEDNVDPTDQLAQVEISKKKLENLNVYDNSRYGSGVQVNVEDPYGLIKPLVDTRRKALEKEILDIEKEATALEQKMEKMVQEIRNKKGPFIEKFKSDIAAELDKLGNAAKGLKSASAETGIDLDI